MYGFVYITYLTQDPLLLAGAFVCRGSSSSELVIRGTNFVSFGGAVPNFFIDGALVNVVDVGECVDQSVIGHSAFAPRCFSFSCHLSVYIRYFGFTCVFSIHTPQNVEHVVKTAEVCETMGSRHSVALCAVVTVLFLMNKY